MRLVLSIIFVLVATTISFSDDSESVKMTDNWIIKTSASSVDDTVAKLETIIENAPPSLMAKINHGANAKKAGMDIGESVLLILGAPKIGTPIMKENRLAGLDLPAKILVYSENDVTKLAYLDPKSLMARHDLSSSEEQLTKMAKALDNFTDKAAE